MGVLLFKGGVGVGMSKVADFGGSPRFARGTSRMEAIDELWTRDWYNN